MDDEVSRIDSLDKKLADQLRKATDTERRTAALAICSLAAHRTGLDDPRIDAAREALASGDDFDDAVRVAVGKLAEEWDEAAWAVEDTDSAAYERNFAKARAAAGFESALDSDAFTAAAEAVYEASYAIGDAKTVRMAVAKTLN